MIDRRTFSKEHFEDLKKQKSINPPILERAIFALGLVEALHKVGMKFVFKGGSSLMLLLDKPMRLSTDVDILVEPGYDVDTYIEKASAIFPFLRKEESVRTSSKHIEKKHFKIYFKSISGTDNELSIILDVVYEHNPYPNMVKKPINNDLLIVDGNPSYIDVPNIDSIIGDKLTAFAPHTIGITFFNEKFSNDKRLEVVKQFYDIATLYNYISDYETIKKSYISVAKSEIVFRGLNSTYKDCLLDTYNSALTILLRGSDGNPDYHHYLEGIRRLRNHIYGEVFSSEIARLYAARVMFLAACLYIDIDWKNASLYKNNIPNDARFLKNIKSFAKAEKTKQAFDLALAAYNIMNQNL